MAQPMAQPMAQGYAQPTSAPPAATGGDDPMEKLTKMKGLLDSGVITQ